MYERRRKIGREPDYPKKTPGMDAVITIIMGELLGRKLVFNVFLDLYPPAKAVSIVDTRKGVAGFSGAVAKFRGNEEEFVDFSTRK